MDSNSKIYVAGNTGLVGSAIVRMLKRKGLNNILSSPSSHWDLRKQYDVERFFEFNKKIKMFETKKSSLAVDVPSDIEKVEKELNKKTPGK